MMCVNEYMITNDKNQKHRHVMISCFDNQNVQFQGSWKWRFVWCYLFFFYQMCFNSNSESTTSRSLKTFSANRRRQTWVMCSRLWIVDYQVHCCMQVFILLAVLFFEFSDDACVHNVTQLTEPNRKAPQVVFFFSPASCTWNKEKTHNVKLKTLKILTTEKVIIISVTVTQGKINR